MPLMTRVSYISVAKFVGMGVVMGLSLYQLFRSADGLLVHCYFFRVK